MLLADVSARLIAAEAQHITYIVLLVEKRKHTETKHTGLLPLQ